MRYLFFNDHKKFSFYRYLLHTGMKYLFCFQAWAKSEQNLLTKYYPRAKHIVINSSDRHMLYRNPDAISEQVIKMIKQIRNKLKIKNG